MVSNQDEVLFCQEHVKIRGTYEMCTMNFFFSLLVGMAYL